MGQLKKEKHQEPGAIKRRINPKAHVSKNLKQLLWKVKFEKCLSFDLLHWVGRQWKELQLQRQCWLQTHFSPLPCPITMLMILITYSWSSRKWKCENWCICSSQSKRWSTMECDASSLITSAAGFQLDFMEL